MADTFREQIIDAWAQPVLKDGFLPEVVRLFQQSGSAEKRERAQYAFSEGTG